MTVDDRIAKRQEIVLRYTSEVESRIVAEMKEAHLTVLLQKGEKT